MSTFWLPKGYPVEIWKALLETLGFRPAGGIYFTPRKRGPSKGAKVAPVGGPGR